MARKEAGPGAGAGSCAKRPFVDGLRKAFGFLAIWVPAIVLDAPGLFRKHAGKLAAGLAVALGVCAGVFHLDGAPGMEDFGWSDLLAAEPLKGAITDWEERVFYVLRGALTTFAGYYFLQWNQLNRDIDGRRPTRLLAAAVDAGRLFERDKFPGLVLGVGGVGKTTLLEYLSHSFLTSRISLTSGNRWTSSDAGFEGVVKQVYGKQLVLGGALRTYNITGATEDYPVAHERRLWDVPGQGWSFGVWDGPIRDAMKSDRAIIVNTMTYGYSAAVRSKENLSEYGVSPEEFERNYAARKRSEELRALRHVINVVVDGASAPKRRGNLTFINMVNMAGLWWGKTREGAAAAEYYCRDPEIAAEWARLEKPFAGRLVLERFLPVSLLFDDITSEKISADGSGCRRQLLCADRRFQKELTDDTAARLDLVLEELYRSNWTQRSGLLNPARRRRARLYGPTGEPER
jgi:hypothetical protein